MTEQESSFPNELQDQIIEHLCNEPTSLAACSLVSSQWSERARTLLFSNATANIFGDINYVDDYSAEKFTKFVELLQAPRSQLGRFIQRICIHGQDIFEDVESERASPERYSHLSSILRVVLPRINRVGEIKLVAVTWKMIPRDLKVQLGLFSKVVSLSWVRIHIDRLDQLILFSAANFPMLKTLRIEELAVKAVSSIERSMFVQNQNWFASLRSLSLFVEESTVPFVVALSSNIVIPIQNIDTLDFEVSHWDYLGCIDSILRAAGPTLSVLKLQIDIYDPFLDNPEFELIPSLRQMAKLKALHFDRTPNKRDLIWIRNILRTTSFAIRKLEEIHLSLSHSELDFPSLEHAILDQHAPNMKVIVKPIEWAHQKSQLLATLEQSLPELSRRGQVHFCGWE
ncbi:hypothetical protein J132_08376 [Termitomyces sp. J132]|nr:hypothetical protein H2248_005483 [Termitomyces sp. 'cryptogamus']KNZ82031.1 hypothetical protein J132_08376 [Termitomyces sp. J132]